MQPGKKRGESRKANAEEVPGQRASGAPRPWREDDLVCLGTAHVAQDEGPEEE